MPTFKIESGIPLPVKNTVFPLRDLKPGQSFFVSNTDPNITKLPFAIKNARRLHQLNLAVRTIEGKTPGIRVWCK